MRISVFVVGAAGRMGREVVRAVAEADGLVLAAAVDTHEAGTDAGTLAGMTALGVPIETDLAAALERTTPDTLVDFTLPGSVLANLRMALAHGVSPVVGTTGLSAE